MYDDDDDDDDDNDDDSYVSCISKLLLVKKKIYFWNFDKIQIKHRKKIHVARYWNYCRAKFYDFQVLRRALHTVYHESSALF